MGLNAKTLPDDEFFFGHAACAGCGGSLAVRHALKVLGPHAVAALPAGCMSAVGFNFPQLCFANNAMITPFAATASVLTGIEAGLRAQGRALARGEADRVQAVAPDDCTVVGFAGDGGTADIGLQALSGAIDRNDDVLYICYDNEAYMNTGIQKSSLTPFGAKTTTTPAGANAHGCLTQKKNLFQIVAAHGILCGHGQRGISQRLHRQGRTRQAHARGTRYIHVIAPCPTGWGCGVDETVEIAKEMVDCGLWYLAEYTGFRRRRRFRRVVFTLDRDPATVLQRRALPAPAGALQGASPTKRSPRSKPGAMPRGATSSRSLGRRALSARRVDAPARAMGYHGAHGTGRTGHTETMPVGQRRAPIRWHAIARRTCSMAAAREGRDGQHQRFGGCA